MGLLYVAIKLNSYVSNIRQATMADLERRSEIAYEFPRLLGPDGPHSPARSWLGSVWPAVGQGVGLLSRVVPVLGVDHARPPLC